KLELWAPVAHNESFQQIEALHVETDGPHAMEAGAHGTQMLHVTRTLTAADRVPIVLTFRATRRERMVQPIAHGSADVRLTAQERDSYLRPDRLVPLDDTI